MTETLEEGDVSHDKTNDGNPTTELEKGEICESDGETSESYNTSESDDEPAPIPVAVEITKYQSELSDDYEDDARNCNAVSITNNLTKLQNDLVHQSYKQNKWRNLFLNSLLYGRFGIIILTLFLLIISLSYCVAQLYNTKLHLVQECDKKDIKEIWHNSYENSLINGEVVMTAESQYGHTKEPCWYSNIGNTTKNIDTNTEQLWYSNVYIPQRIEFINIPCVLYGLLTFYCICIIFYNLFNIIMDIIYVANNKLHTKSKQYKNHQRQQQTVTQNQKPKIEPKSKSLFRKVSKICGKYMATDTSGWIISCFISELVEIFVQSQALLLYNGYNIFDPQHTNNVYLANKSHFILLFASILAFNCFSSGILWLSYSLAPKTCYGLLFKLSLFLVDEFSDLFYTIFPFILVLADNYNKNHGLNMENVFVFLGQLNSNNSIFTFIASFMPLFILCNKSLFIVRSAKNELTNQYYKQWKFIYDITKQTDDKLAIYQAKLNGYHVDIKDLQQNDKELYDSNGKILLDLYRMTSNRNWIQIANNGDKNNGSIMKTVTMYIKQIVLIIISFAYVIYAIILLVLVINYMNKSKSFCNTIVESNYYINGTYIYNENMTLSMQEMHILHNYPELFFWDQC
eukprot:137632_1